MKVPSAAFFSILLGAWIPALGQMVPSQATIPPIYTQPPPTVNLPPYSTRIPAPRVDLVALQREAKELQDLSQSVQPEIESLRHGLLPKDLIDKLKRIEKLSKHLRGEVAPLGN